MTKKIFVFLFLTLGFTMNSMAQNNLSMEVQTMQDQAKRALNQGDYANSIMLLNQAIQLVPNNVSLRRDLAYTYYLSGKPKEAKRIIDPVLDSEFADELTYQLAAAVEGALDNHGKSKRILKNGIRKFPHSGLLYNSQGNLLSRKKSTKSALASYQMGIEAEPSYALNYYSAASQYLAQGNAVWAVLYAEIALNLDANSPRVPAMKKLLFDAYKQLFITDSKDKLPQFNSSTSTRSNENFSTTYRNLMLQNGTVISSEFTVETLTMLRTRFLLNWQSNYASQFPFTLFTFQQKVLQSGYFDAYNQWLLGSYISSTDFIYWVQKHSKLYQDFESWKNKNPLQPASFDPKP